MSANISINTVIENLAELLTNTVNMTDVFYDLFINPTPKDVTLMQYNSENELVQVTVPNRAKDRKIGITGTVAPESSSEAEAAPVGTCYVNTTTGDIFFKVATSGSNRYYQVATKADISSSLTDYVPVTRAINGNTLEADVTLTAADVGAMSSASSIDYGTDLSFASSTAILSLLNENGDTLSTVNLSATQGADTALSNITSDGEERLNISKAYETDGTPSEDDTLYTYIKSLWDNPVSTGTDSYTINGSTVTIAYKVASTGSKIADVAYRTAVSNVYSTFGLSPYYTIDTSNHDVTLPMGEIYGFIESSKTTGYIGQTVFSLDPLYEDGLHLLDGSVLSGNGVYKTFIDNYIKPLYTAAPTRFKSEADWQQIRNTYGVCGFYVYDSVNNTVRLPLLTGFVEGTITESMLGSLVEAGLPNIKAWNITRRNASVTSDGALSDTGSPAQAKLAGGESTFLKTSNFNAHTYSSIYKDSVTTVQPQAIYGYYYIVVSNKANKVLPVNVEGIISDLNNKADKEAVDGQWAYPYAVLANNVTYPTSSNITYDLSSYLPNDGYNYEVLFIGFLTTGSTSGNGLIMRLGTDCMQSNYANLCEVVTRTSSSAKAAGTAILTVGTGRTARVVANSGAKGTFSLNVNGYRRVGTNA